MKPAGLSAVAPELLWLRLQLLAALLVAAVVVHRSWRRLPGFPWGLRTAAAPAPPSTEVLP